MAYNLPLNADMKKKKPRLPSKDWIGLVIDAALQKVPLSKENKIALRKTLEEDILKKIGYIINPSETTFFACVKYDIHSRSDCREEEIKISGHGFSWDMDLTLIFQREDNKWKVEDWSIKSKNEFFADYLPS